MGQASITTASERQGHAAGAFCSAPPSPRHRLRPPISRACWKCICPRLWKRSQADSGAGVDLGVRLERVHGRSVRALCRGERAKVSGSCYLSCPGVFWETWGRDFFGVLAERLQKDVCTPPHRQGKKMGEEREVWDGPPLSPV